MELRHIGYACLNLSLDATTNHTFRLSRLTAEQVAQTTTQNLASLLRILTWNVERGIRLFRVGSSVIPYASHPSFALNWTDYFKTELATIREFVSVNGLRLSMHPGQYTVLNATSAKVVQDAAREVEWQAEFVRQIDPEQGSLVIHVGGAYGDKEASLRRFEENFAQLSSNAQRRLILENDDTTFGADEVLTLCQRLNVPMVFDIFHHRCFPRGADWQDGLPERLEQIVNTWENRVPKLHISSQRPGTRTTHADYITPEDFDELRYWMRQIRPQGQYDLMVEAKLKEKAVESLLGESSEELPAKRLA